MAGLLAALVRAVSRPETRRGSPDMHPVRTRRVEAGMNPGRPVSSKKRSPSTMKRICPLGPRTRPVDEWRRLPAAL
ncbi:MAG TPA: hypothetical protein VIT62_00230 [Lysobacter sp.]